MSVTPGNAFEGDPIHTRSKNHQSTSNGTNGGTMPKDTTKLPGDVSKMIAAKIRGARIEAGLTQEELAEKLGVSFQQVQKYEKGVNRISPDRLQLIAEEVDRPISYFFDISSPPTTPADNDTIANIIRWMMPTRSARRLLAALP